MSKIQEIVRLLHSEGRAEDRKHFTIDRTQAREKMRQFQLADPRHYILKLVQAAVRNGATQIRFEIDSDDMWMHFDGAGFTLVDFENLYGSLFARSDDDDIQALRYLALGLNAATALNPRYIDIISGDAKMRIRPGVDDDWRPADEPVSGTRIHLKERFRPGLVIQFVRNLTGNLTEQKILEKYCRFSLVDIHLGDRPISKGFRLDDRERQVEFDIRGGRALMGLVQDRKPSRAEFIVDGVLIESRALKLAPGIQVLVRSDRVRTDLSAQKLVRNSDFHSLIEELEDGQWKLWSRLAASLKSEVASNQRFKVRAAVTREWPYSSLVEALCDWPGDPNALLESETMAPIVDLSLWVDCRDATILLSIRDLSGVIDRQGSVGYSDEVFDSVKADPENPIALVRRDEERGFLKNLFKKNFKNRAPGLRRLLRQADAEKLFRLRHAQRRLESASQALACVRFGDDEIGGEVGLFDSPDGQSEISCILGGLLLGKKVLPLPIAGLRAVIWAPFTHDEKFNWPRRNAIYARPMLALAASLPALMQEFADSLSASRQHGSTRRLRDSEQRIAISYLQLATRGKPLVDFLHQTGVKQSSAHKWAKAPDAPDPTSLGQLGVGRFRSTDTQSDRRHPVVELLLFQAFRLDEAGRLPIQDTEEEGRIPSRIAVSLIEIQRVIERFGSVSYVAFGSASYVSEKLDIEKLSRDFEAHDFEGSPFVLSIRNSSVGLLRDIFSKESVIDLVASLRANRFIVEHRKKNIEHLVLNEPKLIQIELDDAEGLTGKIAIRANSREQANGKTKRRSSKHEDDARVRILIEQRRFEKSRLPLPGGDRITAVINLDTLRPIRKNAKRLRQDDSYDQLMRALRQGSIELLTQLMDDFDYEMSGNAYEVLLQATAQMYNPSTTINTPEEELANKLSELPLFPVCNGTEGLSAKDLASQLKRYDWLMYVAERPAAPIDFERPVLILAKKGLALRCAGRILGRENLSNSQDWLDTYLAQRRFDENPTLDAIALADDKMLVSMPIEDPGLFGEVGLPRVHPGRKAAPKLTLCFRERIAAKVNRSEACALELIACDKEIPLPRGEKPEKTSIDTNAIWKLAVRAWPSLIEQLVALLPSLSAEDQKVANRHILDFLCKGRTHQAAASLPLFRCTQDSVVSFADLKKEAKSAYRINYLPVETEIPGQVNEALRHRVLLLTEYEKERLQRHFNCLNDYRGELSDLELRHEKWMAAAPLIDVPPSSALSSLREEQKDLALLLWIPDPWDDPAAPPKVQLGLDGVEAGVIQLSAAIPCAGAIHGGGLDIANSVDQAAIPEKRRNWIFSKLFKLVQQLVIELRAPEQIEPERLRSIQDYLAEVLGRLHRAVSSDHGELNQYERNLYDSFLPLPLVETDGGIRVSLRDLLSSDRVATSERLLSMSLGESKISRATGDDPSSQKSRARSEVPDVQTPEGRLIEALLRELQWDENRKIKMVGNIGFHTFGFRDQHPSVIASVDEDRIWLHTRNDLVREILQMPKPDPVLTAIIASAVYSSLNRHFKDITSQDERKFVHELVKAVLANPSG